MISEFLLNIVFGIASGALSLAPDITWNVDTSAFSYVRDIIAVVGYLLPMDTVVAIVSLIIGFTVFRFVIALIRTVWDLLPFA